MKKIKEHYVPQFYLNNFTDNDGLLHIYDFMRKKFYREKSRNVCFVKDLYETKWENANPRLGRYVLPKGIESEFCRYEREFASLLHKLIGVCDLNSENVVLNELEEETLLHMVVNFVVRNPVNMKSLGLTELPEDIKNSNEMMQFRNIMDEMGWGGADSICIAAQKKVMLTENLDGNFPQKCVDRLKQICYSFLFAQGGEFITSDMPICLGNDRAISNEDKTCLYFALNPKLAVLFGNYDVPHRRKNTIMQIGSQYVDFFNNQIVKQHNYINLLIGTSERVIERYITEETELCHSTNVH